MYPPQVDDTHIYHIHVEIMPRIIYHLQFLKDNPDVKILFGCDSRKTGKATDAGVKYAFMAVRPLMEMVGISMDRLILHTHVYADEIYLPMEGACQDPVYNTWSVLQMRKLFLNLVGYDHLALRTGIIDERSLYINEIAIVDTVDMKEDYNYANVSRKLPEVAIEANNQQSLEEITAALDTMKKMKGVITSTSSSSTGGVTMREKSRHGNDYNNDEKLFRKDSTEVHMGKMKMVLLKRSNGAKHTRNGHDLVRQWSDEFASRIAKALEQEFKNYRVEIMSDRNTTLMSCHHCQVAMVADADVLIGVHGAGLAHQLYMKPNSAVMEIGPYQNDGRIFLGGGPFSRLATLLSHNYAIHHPPHNEYKWIGRETSELSISSLIQHLKSFLGSVGF